LTLRLYSIDGCVYLNERLKLTFGEQVAELNKLYSTFKFLVGLYNY
jgi:hypothetical protein